jgi:hypothetical protein
MTAMQETAISDHVRARAAMTIAARRPAARPEVTEIVMIVR